MEKLKLYDKCRICLSFHDCKREELVLGVAVGLATERWSLVEVISIREYKN